MDGTEDLIVSFYAKGMSLRDIQLHLDYELSTEIISNMISKVLELA